MIQSDYRSYNKVFMGYFSLNIFRLSSGRYLIQYYFMMIPFENAPNTLRPTGIPNLSVTAIDHVWCLRCEFVEKLGINVSKPSSLFQ